MKFKIIRNTMFISPIVVHSAANDMFAIARVNQALPRLMNNKRKVVVSNVAEMQSLLNIANREQIQNPPILLMSGEEKSSCWFRYVIHFSVAFVDNVDVEEDSPELAIGAAMEKFSDMATVDKEFDFSVACMPQTLLSVIPDSGRELKLEDCVI